MLFPILLTAALATHGPAQAAPLAQPSTPGNQSVPGPPRGPGGRPAYDPRSRVEQMKNRAARASRLGERGRRRHAFRELEKQRAAAAQSRQHQRPWWTQPNPRSMAGRDACVVESSKYIRHLRAAGWGEPTPWDALPVSDWGRPLCAIQFEIEPQ